MSKFGTLKTKNKQKMKKRCSECKHRTFHDVFSDGARYRACECNVTPEEQAMGCEMFAPKTETRQEKREMVNHPSHYNALGVEVIDMMTAIWGIENTILFCQMNSFKYRMRCGYKDDAQQDIDKALWYEKKARELREEKH